MGRAKRTGRRRYTRRTKKKEEFPWITVAAIVCLILGFIIGHVNGVDMTATKYQEQVNNLNTEIFKTQREAEQMSELFAWAGCSDGCKLIMLNQSGTINLDYCYRICKDYPQNIEELEGILNKIK